MPQQQNAASSRLDQQLQNLIQGQNWKQAITLCEKRIKKGDKSDKLLVTKANILLSCPDQARLQQGRRELDALLSRNPPITDVDALLVIDYEAYGRNDRDPRMELMWERATTALPQDEYLHKVWCELKFGHMDWRSAQKASMKYMRNFSKKREPFFWTILSSFLAGAAPDVSEDDRRLFWPLAYRLLSKAAADVPAGKELLSQGRTLHTLEELFFLLKVYRSQNKYEEALAILDDPRTGIHSRVGRNSWELVRTKIELYETCKLWKDEWQFCWELLEDARPDYLQDVARTSYSVFGKVGDDWKVWAGLVDATFKLRTQEHTAGLDIVIEEYRKQNTTSRNARLALLKHYSLASILDKSYQDKLISACSEHFSDYSSRVVCFRDLHPYLSSLDKSNQEKLLRLAASTARDSKTQVNDSESASVSWITSEINALKLDYNLIISQDDTSGSINLLRAFVCNCLRLYKVSLPLGSTLPVSERRPGDDAAILAVMALLHLHRHGEFNALLRAVAVLECLLSYSKHNYDALLMSVRLYLFLGTPSLAVKAYSVLSIKNIQYATLSWVLLTRISTTHPYLFNPALKVKNGAPALTLLLNALDWHRSASNLGGATTSQMLQTGQYCMMLDNLATQESIQQGFSHYIIILELLRIIRLTQTSSGSEYKVACNEISSRIEDNRDRKAFPDCEATGRLRFEQYLCLGPEPNNQWLGIQLHMSRLWDILHKRPSTISMSQLAELEDRNTLEDETLTGAESSAKDILFGSIEKLYVISVAKISGGQRKDAATEVRTQLGTIEHWLFDASMSFEHHIANMFPLSTGLRIPTWHYFHDIHVLLDVCHFVIAILDLIGSNTHNLDFIDQKFLIASSTRIRELVATCFTNAYHSASRIQIRLKQESAASEIIKAGLGRPGDTEDAIGIELRKLIDRPWMENFGATLRESWVEALNGIVQIKAP